MGRNPRFSNVLAASAFAAILAAPAFAQVRINEILPDPVGTDTAANELIEIYNPGPGSVDMTGWAIDDAATIDEVGVRARIPEDFVGTCPGGVVIGPGEFRVLRMQGSAAVLNNGGDDIYLVSNRTVTPPVVHSVSYGTTTGNVGNVWAALPDGTNNFAWRSPTTFCASNAPPGDGTPPAVVSNLAAVPGLYPGEIRLTWTAPGDDGNVGTATEYVIKVAYAPIASGTFNAGADLDRWLLEPLPQAAGAAETLFVDGFDPDSTYYFALVTRDEVPNSSLVSNSPGTAPLDGHPLNPNLQYNVYYGNLHSHTSLSDGVQTPAQAYAYARTGAPTPLDFLAVTDHNHAGAGMANGNYEIGLAEAAAANDDGDFVAIWGQEWGITEQGHANIFEAPVLFGWDGLQDVFVPQGDYTALYDAVVANPPASYPPLVEFCHPAADDFENYEATPAGLAVVHLMALINGPSQSTSTTESDVGNTNFDPQFREALRKGFRVSPTGDQDNHEANWGASTESRTAVLAAGLTKSQILGALAAGRNYATQDHNVVVNFSANGRPMGSVFASPTGVRIAVRVVDPDPGERVAQIDLFRGITGASDAVVVATSFGNDEFAWRETDVFPDGTEAHYYLRIRMLDNQSIWTGPVYVTYDAATTVAVEEPRGGASLSLALSPNPAPGRVNVGFALPRGERVDLAVYDAAGRRVKSLLGGPLDAGPHHVQWTGRDDAGAAVAPGIFFVRLQAGEASMAKKVLLVR
jgi:hypothetical protein